MRLVTYNILDGGLGRADPLGEVIAAQRADLVTLIEADREDYVRRIARRAGLHALHLPGERRGGGGAQP